MIRGRIHRIASVLAILGVTGCHSSGRSPSLSTDPSQGEVRLAATGGFDAYMVHQGDVGVWTVKCLQVLEDTGSPQVVSLDDKGRCLILSTYSGKWTPTVAVHDREWLGGIAHADIDPRRAGKELYVGGKRGNLYQVWPHAQGGFDANVIAYLPGNEIHTLVADDLDRDRPGNELIAFTRPGGLYMLESRSDGGASFDCRFLQNLPGRVRDAIVLRTKNHELLGVATVSSAGEVGLLRFEEGKPKWAVLFQTQMGLGRIAAKPQIGDDPLVLYVTCDDGRILRLERRKDGSFAPEVIYAGPQGPRGVAAGRFHADAEVESIAIFGYSKKVQLLTRLNNHWRVETIFEDLDKGHWLTVGELDGRNATDEIILSGYGSRVIMLARPPGYGMCCLRDESPTTSGNRAASPRAGGFVILDP